MRVWISGDATVITTKVSYDPFTNQLIGLTLPIDEENGSPVIMSYEAKDEKHIREHLKHRRSHIKVCISCYGTIIKRGNSTIYDSIIWNKQRVQINRCDQTMGIHQDGA